jgi:hypothetical protein
MGVMGFTRNGFAPIRQLEANGVARLNAEPLQTRGDRLCLDHNAGKGGLSTVRLAHGDPLGRCRGLMPRQIRDGQAAAKFHAKTGGRPSRNARTASL